jgi:hypothetical protein
MLQKAQGYNVPNVQLPCSLEVTYEFLILNRIYSYNVLQQISPE